MTRKHKSFGFAWWDLVRTILGITHMRTAELRAAAQDAKDAQDALELTQARKRLVEAQTIATQARAAQIPHQTQGIVSRYRQTDENRINAMLRQQRQEIEMLKLKLQILEKQRELGITPSNEQEFKPVNYP